MKKRPTNSAGGLKNPIQVEEEAMNNPLKLGKSLFSLSSQSFPSNSLSHRK
jgi:hypothetical protein